MNKKLFPYYNDVRILRLPTTRWAVSTQSRTEVMKEIGLPEHGETSLLWFSLPFLLLPDIFIMWMHRTNEERFETGRVLTPTAAAVIWSSSILASVNWRPVPSLLS